MLLNTARYTVQRQATSAVGRRNASAIALKYSQALYSAALSKSPATLSKVQTELNTVVQAIKDVPAVKSFITNPTLSAEDRAKGLEALLAKVEGSGSKKEVVTDITKNLIKVLSENGRLIEVEGVIEGFSALVAEYKGELTVTVTSAQPLPKDVLARLETTLKQSQAAQKAKSLKIVNKVQPTVLGGLVVDFGDKTVDLSVSSRVTKLNGALQGKFNAGFLCMLGFTE